MLFKKNKKKTKERKYIDNFIYVFLVIFIIICFSFKLNLLLTSILAIVFVLLIFIFYILSYNINKRLLIKDPYNEKINNLSVEELKEIIIKYYTFLKYKMIENNEYLIIEKNNKKYKVIFLLGQININDLKNIKSVTKDVSETIIINNSNINKIERRFIKEKGFFSITKPGLIEILKNLEKQDR